MLSALQEASMDFKYLFFSFEGRINRAKFWLASLMMAAIYMVTNFMIMFAIGLDQPLTTALALVTMIAGIWPIFALYVKRLHDRDKSAWWLLVFFAAPLVIDTAFQAWSGTLTWPWQAPPIENFKQMVFGPAWWISWAAQAGIALWAFVELGCLRGTEGPNQFGPDPLPQEATA
jgi:uncharacterized membrane protein YhaH (DUF805 family)